MISSDHKLCLLNKRNFVDRLSYAICGYCGQVVDIRYEAYESKDDSEPQEFIILTFIGGAISVRNVHLNSHSAILRDIGRLIDGGYYDEVEYYNKLQTDSNWKKIFHDSKKGGE